VLTFRGAADLLEFAEKNLNKGSSIQFCQNFINEGMDASGEVGGELDGVAEQNKQLPNSPLSEPNGNAQVQVQASKNGDEKGELGATSKIRRMGFCFSRTCVNCQWTLTPNQSIRDWPEGQSLMSKDQNFELGFFRPGNSSYRYLGIRFVKVKEQTLVWVANREDPINGPSDQFSQSTSAESLSSIIVITVLCGLQMFLF